MDQYNIYFLIAITINIYFSSTPTYSLNPEKQLSDDSIVQVYALNDKFEPLDGTYILDNITMAFLLGKYNRELFIVDFEISYNGFIFLLDAQYGLFAVRFRPTGKWELFAQSDFQLGRSFSFDIDYEHKKDGSELGVVAVLGYNFFAILDAEKSNIHDLPFLQLDYPASIKMSQDNIIIRNQNNVYFYKLNVDTDTIYLNYKIDVPITDYIFGISIRARFDIIKYSISDGYLKYNGSTQVQDKKVVILKAKAQNLQECKVYIQYQIVEENDNLIYQLFDKPMPFPKTISEGQTQSILKKLSSGPNLYYQFKPPANTEATTITATFNSRVQLNLKHDQSQNIIYAEIVSTEDNTQFYQVLQSENLKIQILSCVNNSIYNDQTLCEVYVESLEVKNKVTKKTFQFGIKMELYFLYTLVKIIML